VIAASLEQQSVATRAASPKEQPPVAVLPLVAVLRQVSAVLHAMSDEQYRRKPVGPVSSNVGGHVRHCRDHLDALLNALETGAINYDLRQRGTDIETCRAAALESLVRQERQLLAFPADSEEWPLRLTILVSSALPPLEVGTTVGRELAFVLSHTIHHNALIAVMAQTLGVPLPERFGYAPSTISYLETTACAR
jgi:uncharacterized damage-inducible protein DinB